NHVLGWAKLAPISSPQAVGLGVLGWGVVAQPFDPMFTWNDSILIHPLTPGDGDPPSPPTADSVSVFYRAADHVPMSETRRWTMIAQATRLAPRSQWHVAAGWQHGSELVSPGLARDARILFPDEKVRFGQDMDPKRDPFRAYAGDWPYFRRARSDRWLASASGTLMPSAHARLGAGAGLQGDRAELEELDSAPPTDSLIDTVRSFRTRAPGGWAYVQHRWEREGLVWNGGVRFQVFDAGDARAPLGVTPGGAPVDQRSPGAWWTIAPRCGPTSPISVRDAMSVSYARIHQAPGRESLADDRLLVFSRRPLGNPALEPSELVTYQAGVKHLFNERWAAQVAVFHRDLFGQV